VLTDVVMNGDAGVLAADPEHRADEPTVTRLDRLLTAEQLAARWQVPKSHVYRLTREGRIPTVRLGRYYRYRIAAVEAWERQSEALAVAAA
jgi:excisionase family DNA binding protein